MSNQDLSNVDTTSSQTLIPRGEVSNSEAGYISHEDFVNEVSQRFEGYDHSTSTLALKMSIIDMVDKVMSIYTGLGSPVYLLCPNLTDNLSLYRSIYSPGQSTADKLERLHSCILPESHDDAFFLMEMKLKLARVIIDVSFQLYARNKLLASGITNANWAQNLDFSTFSRGTGLRLLTRVMSKVEKELPYNTKYNYVVCERTIPRRFPEHEEPDINDPYLYNVRKVSTLYPLSFLTSGRTIRIAIPEAVMARYVRYLQHKARARFQWSYGLSLRIAPESFASASQVSISSVDDIRRHAEASSLFVRVPEDEKDFLLYVKAGDIDNLFVDTHSSGCLIHLNNSSPHAPRNKVSFFEHLESVVQVTRTLHRGHLCRLNKGY